MVLWDTHYAALLPFTQHPWQLGRPLSPQKFAFNWVTSNQGVKYSSRVNKTGQWGTRTTSCNSYHSRALSRCWPTHISLVLMNKITGFEVFLTRSLGECVIGYDEPFLKLHQLWEEACLWCAKITGAERSHMLCLNTHNNILNRLERKSSSFFL